MWGGGGMCVWVVVGMCCGVFGGLFILLVIVVDFFWGEVFMNCFVVVVSSDDYRAHLCSCWFL